MNEFLGGNEFVQYFDVRCGLGNGMFQTMDGLRKHCVKVNDFPHQLYHSYLLGMHSDTMELVGQTMNAKKTCMLKKAFRKKDKEVYINQTTMNEKR